MRIKFQADADADLDEAVHGVVLSAFGYAGQKCSACSRAVVLETIYDQFLPRLRCIPHLRIIGRFRLDIKAGKALKSWNAPASPAFQVLR